MPVDHTPNLLLLILLLEGQTGSYLDSRVLGVKYQAVIWIDESRKKPKERGPMTSKHHRIARFELSVSRNPQSNIRRPHIS
jgi:hypothetical protein